LLRGDGVALQAEPVVDLGRLAAHHVTTGKSNIRFEFAYHGGGVAKGGTGTIFGNDKQVATARIEQTQCCAFSADEG
jgi:hypothetical protein